MSLATLVGKLFPGEPPRTWENKGAGGGRAHHWICASYLLAATSSALGHLYVMSKIATSENHAVDIVRMYVPFLFTGPSGTSDILVRGPWLFLQYDFIIISLSSLSWAFLVLGPIYPKWHISAVTLALAMLISSVIIGPGGTVSIALLIRERYLPDQSSVSHKS